MESLSSFRSSTLGDGTIPEKPRLTAQSHVQPLLRAACAKQKLLHCGMQLQARYAQDREHFNAFVQIQL